MIGLAREAACAAGVARQIRLECGRIPRAALEPQLRRDSGQKICCTISRTRPCSGPRPDGWADPAPRGLRHGFAPASCAAEEAHRGVNDCAGLASSLQNDF